MSCAAWGGTFTPKARGCGPAQEGRLLLGCLPGEGIEGSQAPSGLRTCGVRRGAPARSEP
jgi:hypothetical protein